MRRTHDNPSRLVPAAHDPEQTGCHQFRLVDGTKNCAVYKFWMDLTCDLATVRLAGAWIQGVSAEGKNFDTTVFTLVYDVLTQLNPKKDF